MRHFSLGKLLLPLFLALVFDPSLWACTNLIVTKGASKDGSVICTYNCDTFGYSGWLTHSPAGRHEKGEKIAVRSFWHPAEIKGYVDQAEYTYNVVGYINEKQLCKMFKKKSAIIKEYFATHNVDQYSVDQARELYKMLMQ